MKKKSLWKLFSEPVHDNWKIRLGINIGKITFPVTVPVAEAAVSVTIHHEAAGQVLLHHGVVDHQGREAGEHLAEALDAPAALGADHEVVQDAGTVVEGPWHADGEGQGSGLVAVRHRVPDHEGAHGTVSQDLERQR